MFSSFCSRSMIDGGRRSLLVPGVDNTAVARRSLNTHTGGGVGVYTRHGVCCRSFAVVD